MRLQSFFLMLLCLSLAFPVLGANADYDSLMAAGKAAYNVGDLVAAEKAYTEALTLAKRGDRETPDVSEALYRLGNVYEAAKDYKRAESLFKEVISLDERLHGPLSQAVADASLALADLYYQQSRYGDAEPLYKHAIAIEEKLLGAEHRYVTTDLNKLANVYKEQGRYNDAEQIFQRVLFINEKAYGTSHSALIVNLTSLAGVYWLQGRYSDADSLLHRALTIAKSSGDEGTSSISAILNLLSCVYIDQGRYAEAIPLAKQALTLGEKTHGPEHPDVAADLNNLAEIYRSQGRYNEAVPLYQRALSINEKILGLVHPTTASLLDSLASTYVLQARYNEAEPLYKQVLTIREKLLGAEHPDVANVLNNLAALYTAQGRYADAEPLYKRALAIDDKALGSTHPSLAIDLNNLGTLYHLQGRNADAVSLFERALAIDEKVLGGKHPELAKPLGNLAGVYEEQGRLADAERLYQRALAIEESALGSVDPDVAVELNNIALLYARQGRFDEALSLSKRALMINEKVFGNQHPTVAKSLGNIATILRTQGRYTEALRYSIRAVTILHQRSTLVADSRPVGAEQERREVRSYFVGHVMDISHSLGEGATAAKSVNEAFETAQLAGEQSAAQALAQMAARFAAGSDALARQVRERQDLLDQWRALDKHLIEAVSAPPAERHADVEQRLREERQAVETKLKAADALLSKEFPDYAALANPQPISIAEVQAQLHPDEAMVMYLVGEKASYLWVVNKREARFVRLEIGHDELAKQIKRLRSGLDQKDIANIDDLRAFDVKRAHHLYELLLAPAAAQLQGIKTLLLVPDGPLQSLPFAVLVTEAPAMQPRQLQDYRTIPWLINRYALATLPSAGSLKALRRFAKRSDAPQPFIGFGDPSLGAGSGGSRGVDAQALFSRGGLADLKALRQLPSLPDTAQELHTLAKTLKASNDTVYLQGRATETRVEQTPLSRYRVVAFATHGLMAGEFSGQAEPALVLTPPKQVTAQDDGLLTASEVAQLKLNADWVVLSACNTAAPDGTPGAEGLSGLARAFFYAGGRALLVSNWSVSSQAAQELTTTLFKRQAAEPELGQAQALSEAMQAVRDDPQHPYFAHPFFWAPFIVVGAGE